MEPQAAQSAPFGESDAFRVQVAAVVAQQAEVAEQAIRLCERDEAWQTDRDALLDAVEDLLARVQERDEELGAREVQLREDEGRVAQLGQTCAWLRTQVLHQADQLARSRQLLAELGRTLTAAETHLAQTEKALERVQRFLGDEPEEPHILSRAA